MNLIGSTQHPTHAVTRWQHVAAALHVVAGYLLPTCPHTCSFGRRRCWWANCHSGCCCHSSVPHLAGMAACSGIWAVWPVLAVICHGPLKESWVCCCWPTSRQAAAQMVVSSLSAALAFQWPLQGMWACLSMMRLAAWCAESMTAALAVGLDWIVSCVKASAGVGSSGTPLQCCFCSAPALHHQQLRPAQLVIGLVGRWCPEPMSAYQSTTADVMVHVAPLRAMKHPAEQQITLLPALPFW